MMLDELEILINNTGTKKHRILATLSKVLCV